MAWSEGRKTKKVKMRMNTATRIGLITLVLLTTGCASKRTDTLGQRPIVKTIAVLPVNDPEKFALENRNLVRALFPIAGLAGKLDSRDKAKVFTAMMLQEKKPFANNLAKAVVDALNAQGYQAFMLSGTRGGPDDPSRIAHTKLNDKADAVLRVSFDEIGVYSGDVSSDYLPKISVDGRLFSTVDGKELYEQSLHYGVRARENVTWGVQADPKFSYPTFEALIEQPAKIADGLDSGAQALGKRMAENIKKAL